MISTEDRILVRLEQCISPDKKDPRNYHIQLDRAVEVLKSFGVVVPPKQFEEAVTEILNKAAVGKLRVGKPAIYIMAKAVYDIASLMKIDGKSLKTKKAEDVLARASADKPPTKVRA